MSIAFGVSLRELGAYLSRLEETSPPSPQDIADAREMVRGCYERAKTIKARMPQVKAALLSMPPTPTPPIESSWRPTDNATTDNTDNTKES